MRGVEIRPEVFRLPGGGPARRREATSLGIDELVLWQGTPMLAFDLKLGRRVSSSRARNLANRFDVGGVFEVEVNIPPLRR